MATSFPTGLDSLTNPTSGDTLDSPDHAGQHADANDAIEALQAKVGVDSSAVTTSLDYLVRYAAPVGAVTSYVGSTAPDSSWVICNGAAISRTTYSDLYALIGTTYGSGDGSTTFNVPNLKGRVIVGFDSANGSFDVLGETGGAETHTLTEAELPSHNHSIDHDHASVTSGSGGAAHTHSIDHNHGSVTSGSSGNAHTHSIDPPSTTSSSDSHSHSQGGLSTNSQASGKFTKRIGSGSNWDVTSASLARWDSATNPATTSDSHTHSTNIGAFTSGGASATSHTHSVDLPNFTGTSGSATASHTHSVDVESYSGNSGSSGSGTAHNNLQPYMALNWIIKAK